MKYRPGRVNGKADALSRVARGNHEKEILHADDLAEIQLENISVTQSTPVPVELRELVTTYTSQEQLSTSIPEMTFTNLPSHSPAELWGMQIADPVISRLHYYRQNNRKPTPPRKERRITRYCYIAQPMGQGWRGKWHTVSSHSRSPLRSTKPVDPSPET